MTIRAWTLALALAGAPSAAAECSPWAGEPSPLPTVADARPTRARWAALRADELAQHARVLEGPAPVEAHHMWQRVLCLDPGYPAATAGLDRTRPVSVHVPPLVPTANRALVSAPAEGDGWSQLSAPLAVFAPRAGGDVVALLEREEVTEFVGQVAAEELLSELEGRVRGARFEEALELAARARPRLTALRAEGRRQSRLARLEVLSATAEVALGRQREARASMRRALSADPQLDLDSGDTSPKVLRVFHAARAESGR